MPSSPQPDPSWWFDIINHVEAIITGLLTAFATALTAVWRMAIWTAEVQAEMAKMREASDERHTTLLDKLDQMQDAQRERHEATQREMDQMHLDVRADRQETSAMRQEQREAAASLSARIDSLFGRRT